MKPQSVFLLILILFCSSGVRSQDSTYAEKLGYPKGAKVLILHVDDAGMSYSSNRGAERALTEGASNSVSVMMPCPWVPDFVDWLKAHPGTDAGLHLTLTSEWDEYRWVPLSGKKAAPGLTDSSGCLWPEVKDVVLHASADEVEMEMQAQLDRALLMGFKPTHLDTHMGTVYGTPAFLMRYLQLGIKNHIPVMLPGGRDKVIQAEMKSSDSEIKGMQDLGRMLWAAGLPVLDDLHNVSYDWKIPEADAGDLKKLQEFKVKKYIEALGELQPGVTMMIMHCTDPTPEFAHISASGTTRQGDLLAMLSPVFKKALKDQGLIVTTWAELMSRRQKVH